MKFYRNFFPEFFLYAYLIIIAQGSLYSCYLSARISFCRFLFYLCYVVGTLACFVFADLFFLIFARLSAPLHAFICFVQIFPL